MAGVYCPICEADVEPAAKYCLSCGHDMDVQGPITSTGHDLNQLREVIRLRDDLSMAEKFDMIAKIEEGANTIVGIRRSTEVRKSKERAANADKILEGTGMRAPLSKNNKLTFCLKN